jgi:ABC-type sugar transport system ATPase subunit
MVARNISLQAQMRLELVRLHRELQTTMVYVTHDQLEAMTMADRIVVLNVGRVEQWGSPLELYQNPATLFVAGFIGAPRMNFLDAEVKATSNQHVCLVLSNGASVTVPAPAEELKPGEGIKLGVRPEHVALEAEGEIEGEIDALEHLGPRAYLHAGLPDGSRLVVQTDGDTPLHVGDRVAFRIRSHATHLFDRAGKALTRSDARLIAP